jgi:hypothetical protein
MFLAVSSRQQPSPAGHPAAHLLTIIPYRYPRHPKTPSEQTSLGPIRILFSHLANKVHSLYGSVCANTALIAGYIGINKQYVTREPARAAGH